MPRGVTPPGAPDTDDFGGVRIEKMSRMRQTIARNMVESYTTIPQLTNFDDADVTELEDMREQSKADYADRGIKLTAMPFVIKAVASSLKRHPMLNASVDMENNQIIYKEYVNIGIAVDTERGLVVPVLRDADRKSISQIASELDELADHGPRRQVRPRAAQRRHVHDQQPGLGRRHVLDADHQPAASRDPARRPHPHAAADRRRRSRSRG